LHCLFCYIFIYLLQICCLLGVQVYTGVRFLSLLEPEDEQGWHARYLHRKKSFSIFPSSVGILLTKLYLGGNYDGIHKLFLPRESLVSDILAGDGNIENLFYGVWTYFHSWACQRNRRRRELFPASGVSSSLYVTVSGLGIFCIPVYWTSGIKLF
jgi:hypothetical protein